MPSDQNRIYFTPLCFALGVMSLSLVPAHAHAAAMIAIMGDGSNVPFKFNPANVTIKSGDKVTWANETSVEHSVTPDGGFQKKLKGKDIAASKGSSGVIKAGPGPIRYHCKYHPSMKGTVTVTGR